MYAIRSYYVLARYTAGWRPELRTALLDLSRAFNQGEAAATVLAWQALQPWLPQWREQAINWPESLLVGGNLASRLVQFAEKKLECGA